MPRCIHPARCRSAHGAIAAPRLQPGAGGPVFGHVTWLSVLSGSSIRYALVGTVMAAVAVAAAVLVCLAVPVLIVRSRLAGAR